MDTFVKNFFSQFEAPGAEFKTDFKACTTTYFGANLRVSDGHTVDTRSFFANQKMTYLGKMEASMEGGPSSLDGLTRQYLTPEGTVNLSTLADAIKQSSGMQTAVWSAHVAHMRSWSWADNHVALLLNMLRYCFLKRAGDSAVAMGTSLGNYNDGHVTVNMDQWWDERYKGAEVLTDWPGGREDANYPDFTRLVESAPSTGDDALDLRTLTMRGARFVLLMMAKWRRTSRVRLDFELPKLADRAYYRYGATITNLDDWIGNASEKAPELISSEEAWSALKAYVTQNRLFDHFSVALFLLCSAAYQFLPATAESTAWLKVDWHLLVPRFRSIRGRYSILNEGEAALVSHRAMSEWGYINGKLEKVNLMALVFTQAYMTGMAVRSIRKGMEMDPDDLYSTEAEFYQASNMVSAAVSEATRSPAPLPGMSSAYLYTDFRFDDYQAENYVETENSTDDDLLGYDVDYGVGEKEVEEEVELDPRADDRVAESERAAIVLLMEAHAAAARAKLGIKADIELQREEIAAVAGRALVTLKVKRVIDKVRIRVPWMTLPGLPTLIMPLDPFPYNSPLSLRGVLSPEIGKMERHRFQLKAPEGWLVANLARLCGYDLELRLSEDTAGSSNYFAPNDVNFVWPIMHEPDYQGEHISVTDQVERENHFIHLPPMHNRFFTGVKLEYEIKVMRRGVARGVSYGRTDINEWGGHVVMKKDVTVSYNVPEGVTRLRGYITRGPSGFRFADDVQAGVIPQPAETVSAPAVVVEPAPGGSKP